jgi:hypothetical protein
MFLDLRIVKKLRAHFVGVRILQGLCVKRLRVGGGAPDAFELTFAITRKRIPYW